MPKVTIWIRVEDWEAWQAINDKPAFIHDAIQLKEMYKDKQLPVHFIKLKKGDLKGKYSVKVKPGKSLPIEPTVEPLEETA